MTPSPFPGMDPYLESADLWPDVHDTLPLMFREQLAPLLAPNYVAELNTQIVIERWWDDAPFEEMRLPDLTITQTTEPIYAGSTLATITPPTLQRRIITPIPTRHITVYLRLRRNNRIVTVVELLSPFNKKNGAERDEYLEKRAMYVQSGMHIVEIDLLRRGPRMPFEGSLPRCDYLIAVRNAYQRLDSDLWSLSVRNPLPVIPIPLLRPDPDVPLDLGDALRTAYQRARYDLRIDYANPPDPPFRAQDVEWVEEIRKQHLANKI